MREAGHKKLQLFNRNIGTKNDDKNEKCIYFNLLCGKINKTLNHSSLTIWYDTESKFKPTQSNTRNQKKKIQNNSRRAGSMIPVPVGEHRQTGNKGITLEDNLHNK